VLGLGQFEKRWSVREAESIVHWLREGDFERRAGVVRRTKGLDQENCKL